MIMSDSRYVDSPVFLSYNARKRQYDVTVPRAFPRVEGEFFFYTWKSADRIDQVALNLMGNGDLWWRIMDFNPEILNPMVITPGTQLRIPSNA